MVRKQLFLLFLKYLKINFSSTEISNNCVNNDIKSNESLINDFHTIKLSSGDYCIVSYFKDFENIYLCKAIKNCENDCYEMHNLHIILKTMMSEGQL